MDALIGILALVFAVVLLRYAARHRWVMVITVILLGGLARMASRNGGNEVYVAFGIVIALLFFTAYVLVPWIGRWRITMVAKGAAIILWQRMNGLARVAEDAAKADARSK